ncbi:mRNA-capping enzyme subunit beta [Malassezia nana]|uniref:mRNA-capping enzyme subunit beta n=1 Tax=Malassezia nana TaxID=180528 RepID=A0AAF0EKV6_9BASI|nr:mRNA-capping enzyme subunit beta [Malassezia nana]
MEEGPTLVRSIFGVDPLDEFSVFVSDWIMERTQGLDHVEIEAKVGTLIDRQTNMRLQLPVLTETAIDARALGVRFESNMPMKQHRSFNQLLNELVHYSSGMEGARRVFYKHVHETDSFHDEVLPTGEHVHLRVTRDSKTQQIKPGGVVAKKRIDDLNVFCPMRMYDFRISISTETPMPPPPENSVPTFVREKDRLSYSLQDFQVDLTQVMLPHREQEPIHELEVEIKQADELVRWAQYTRNSSETREEWTQLEDHVLVLLNNIRLLIRNASYQGAAQDA